MENLRVRDNSKIFTSDNNGNLLITLAILDNEQYIASAQLNLKTRECEIINSYSDIPEETLKKCIYKYFYKDMHI